MFLADLVLYTQTRLALGSLRSFGLCLKVLAVCTTLPGFTIEFYISHMSRL